MYSIILSCNILICYVEKFSSACELFFCTSANKRIHHCKRFASFSHYAHRHSPPSHQTARRGSADTRRPGIRVAQYSGDLIIIINLHYVRDVTLYGYYYFVYFSSGHRQKIRKTCYIKRNFSLKFTV